MRPHSQFPIEDKGRRSSQPMTTSVNWRNGQRAAAWEELWRRILRDVASSCDLGTDLSTTAVPEGGEGGGEISGESERGTFA